MFKCKECGAEYEQKPDFCDCGNDEFEVVIPQEKTPAPSPALAQEVKKININEQKPKVQPASSFNTNAFEPKPQKTFDEQYPAFSRALRSIDPISGAIFGLCILLSFYVVFFAWNSKESDIKVTETKTTEAAKNIPSIDKFWNNTPPAVKKEEPKHVESVEPVKEIVKQIIPNKITANVSIPVQKTQPKTLTVKVQTPKQTTKTTNTNKTTANTKVQTQQKTQTQQKSIFQPTTQQQTNTTQEQAKKAAEEAAKQKAEQERKAAEAAQIKKLQEEQARKQAELKAQQSAAAKQEFANYKINLRNTIGRKIDFTRVIGDGDCTVAFKINQSGQLTNRSFAKQSSNMTLNDAVYNAVMSTPSFNPPPSAYNNETLNLTIKFYNGNFEISLK